MAKQIELGSHINGLFRFNEMDAVSGFYKGTFKMEKGKGIILSTLNGDKAVGVPLYATIRDLPEKVESGDFVALKYEGTEKGKNSNNEYYNIKSWAWRLNDNELENWDEKNCNVEEVLNALPDYEPEENKGGKDDKIDDLPF